MKLTKTLTLAVAAVAAASSVNVANATDFANDKFRFDLNAGFKGTRTNVDISDYKLSQGAYTLGFAAHYFVFNNNKVAVGLGLDLDASIGRYTIGGRFEHYTASNLENRSNVATTNSKSYFGYSGALSGLVQFNATPRFTPYVKLTVGYVYDRFKVDGQETNYVSGKGFAIGLGGGVSWSNGFTLGVYTKYSPDISFVDNNTSDAKQTTYGVTAGWKW